MHHAGRRAARRVDRERLHLTDVVGIAVLEQGIELAAVALEFGAFVEHFTKGLLHNHDLVADTDLATQTLLNIGCGTQVIGVDVGFDDPVQQRLRSLTI